MNSIKAPVLFVALALCASTNAFAIGIDLSIAATVVGSSALISSDAHSHHHLILLNAEIQKLKAEAYQYSVTSEVSPALESALSSYEGEFLKGVSQPQDLSTEEKITQFYIWLTQLEEQNQG